MPTEACRGILALPVLVSAGRGKLVRIHLVVQTQGVVGVSLRISISAGGHSGRRPHEGVLVAVAEEVVHVSLLHHMVGDVQDGKVEPIVASLVKQHLA